MKKHINWAIYNFSKRQSRRGINTFIDQQLARLHSPDRLLSVGAGGAVGTMVRAAADKYGFTLTESDIDPDRRPAVVDDICSSSLASGCFDAVILIEVIEHLKEPQQAVRELARLLKPGGRVIATTPFMFPVHDKPHDFFRYTRFGLMYIFRDFQNVQVEERNDALQAVAVLLMRMGPFSGTRGKLAMLFMLPMVIYLLSVNTFFGSLFSSKDMPTGYYLTADRTEPE